MDYAVYPFKRENKYRLYLKYTTASGKRKALSTGVTYPLNASKKERKKAHQEAERSALNILVEHFQDRGFMKGQQEDEVEDQAMLLSDYLEEYYWPRVRSNCAESTVDTVP